MACRKAIEPSSASRAWAIHVSIVAAVNAPCCNCWRSRCRGVSYSLRNEGEVENIDNPIAVDIYR